MPPVTVEHRVSGSVHTIRIDRESAGNSIGCREAVLLHGAVDAVEADPSAAGLVLTGAGTRFFCAGGDLKEYLGELAGDEMRDQFRRMRALCDRLAGLPVPSVVALNGVAIGGGVELALTCDLRFMAPEATLRLSQVSLGLVTGWGGHRRLVRLVGESVATDLLLSGREVDAAEALSLGLVNRVTEDPAEAAAAYAERWTAAPPSALRTMKRMLLRTRPAAPDDPERELDEFLDLWPPRTDFLTRRRGRRP